MFWSTYLPNPTIPQMGSRRFVGQRVAVAYSLHECRVDKPPKPEEFCFTVRAGGTSGKVVAHVDRILLEDVTFVVRESGVTRIRESGVREVIAFAVGTVRDPAKALRRAELDSAVGLAFDPHRDRTFVLREDRSIPVYSAKWAYFAGRRGIVLGHSRRLNPYVSAAPIERASQLELLARTRGGTLG